MPYSMYNLNGKGEARSGEKKITIQIMIAIVYRAHSALFSCCFRGCSLRTQKKKYYRLNFELINVALRIGRIRNICRRA